jgi:hypothetical protein
LLESEDHPMAKPLGPKSILIRQAITAHPDKTPKELSELLNDSHDRMDDKLKFTPNDISQQKQAMKKPGATTAPAGTTAAASPTKPAGNGRKKPGRKPGRKPAVVAPAAAPRPGAAASGSPVDLIDKTFALAQECGGMENLKRLVDRLAGVREG